MEYGRAVIVEDLRSVELAASQPIIYDREIYVKALYENPGSGAEHYLIRYPVGLHTRLHRHTAAHTIIVLDGRLEVNGRVIGPGSYCHFPAGEAMRHTSAGGDCLFVVIFDGPLDMEPLE